MTPHHRAPDESLEARLHVSPIDPGCTSLWPTAFPSPTLHRPQAVYTNDQTRQIFDKLAHSSIMKLNKSSMEKLYDLMSMGFKHQILGCAAPAEYIQVTN